MPGGLLRLNFLQCLSRRGKNPRDSLLPIPPSRMDRFHSFSLVGWEFDPCLKLAVARQYTVRLSPIFSRDTNAERSERIRRAKDLTSIAPWHRILSIPKDALTVRRKMHAKPVLQRVFLIFCYRLTSFNDDCGSEDTMRTVCRSLHNCSARPGFGQGRSALMKYGRLEWFIFVGRHSPTVTVACSSGRQRTT